MPRKVAWITALGFLKITLSCKLTGAESHRMRLSDPLKADSREFVHKSKG